MMISDGLWERLAPLLPGKATDRGTTARDNRLFPEALFRTVRTGSPWRDRPDRFGKWNRQFRRLRRWSTSGVLERLFETLRGDTDLECVLVDGTIVSVHQKASGGHHEKLPLPHSQKPAGLGNSGSGLTFSL